MAYGNLDIVANRLLCFGGMPEPGLSLGPEMVEYYKTPAQVVVELVKRIDWKAEDVFIDLGAGLGQVVLLVHLLAGVRARGIEIEAAYCEYAERCAARLGLAGVEFICADARMADLSEGTVFFLFTPFRGEVFSAVMERLRAVALKRVIRVIGYGPCSEEIANLGWLEEDGMRNGMGKGGLGKGGTYSLRCFTRKKEPVT
jgi:SAM-dependent methyltransferase